MVTENNKAFLFLVAKEMVRNNIKKKNLNPI